MKKRNPFHKHWISEKLSSVSPRTRHYRRSLFSILVFGVLLSGCSGLLAKDIVPIQRSAAELTFEQHEIVTGTAKHQTVLTGFLLSGAIADLAVSKYRRKQRPTPIHLRVQRQYMDAETPHQATSRSVTR